MYSPPTYTTCRSRRVAGSPGPGQRCSCRRPSWGRRYQRSPCSHQLARLSWPCMWPTPPGPAAHAWRAAWQAARPGFVACGPRPRDSIDWEASFNCNERINATTAGRQPAHAHTSTCTPQHSRTHLVDFSCAIICLCRRDAPHSTAVHAHAPRHKSATTQTNVCSHDTIRPPSRTAVQSTGATCIATDARVRCPRLAVDDPGLSSRRRRQWS